ncbi:MAG: hypothetical protein KBD22_02520 [Candidatus Pacebacteria bacterium]|nr:hypothetical protein [Candidatus Paceibacterota bacterium]
MKNLFFVILLSLVAMSTSAQSVYVDIDTLLIKTEAGFDTLIISDRNKIFSGTSAVLMVDNEKKFIFVEEINFPDGSVISCKMPFPPNIVEIKNTQVVRWEATRSTATNIYAKIFLEIDGLPYSFEYGKGWK